MASSHTTEKQDPAAVLRLLRASEGELLELSESLDEPIRPDEYRLAILALGQRARTLFRGFIGLQDTAAPAAGRALLRPMIEINTLIRFLHKNPELHLELWEAEGDRNVVSIIEEHKAKHAERWGLAPFDENELEEKRQRVRDARAKALAAGVVGVGEKGPVLPNLAKQLLTIAEPAASEAYTFGYRPMSWETHTNARVFLGGAFEQRNDGTVSYSDATEESDLIGIRALSLTTFASTLELVAIVLGLLTVEESARAILRSFVPEQIPADQRFDGRTDADRRD
jgi:hypothetical protein